MATRTAKLGSLAPGVNNKLPPTQLARVSADRSTSTFLAGADNVDINERGFLRRRRGITSALAGAAHSLWSDGKGAYAVLDGVLTALDDTGTSLSARAIRSGMPGRAVSYSRGADGDVYWSNGDVIRRIALGVDRPVACEPIANVPPITVTAGALPAGRYLVALTVSSADGESPATTPVQVDMPANSGLLIDSEDLIARTAHLYVSGTDGDILFRRATSQLGTLALVALPEGGVELRTAHLAVMPAGSIVRHFNGRLLVVRDSMVFVSDPYNYGLFDPSKSYIPFPAAVTIVEPVEGGVYVCADKTYFLTDLGAGPLQDVLPYGGIAGTGGLSPVGKQAFWQSPRGLVVGDSSGSAVAVQEPVLAFSAAASGATLYRERNGMTHILASRAGVQPTQAAAASFMDAEVIRQGTIL